MRLAHVRGIFNGLAALAGVVTLDGRALAQSDGPHTAQPERPSVATHAYTVAPGWLEIEAGGERDRLEGESQGRSLPFAAKIGLAPRVQLSVLGALERPPGSGASLPDVTVGLKWRVADDVPGVGALAILPAVTVPFDSHDGGLGTGIVGIASHDFGVMALDLNVGYARMSGSDVAPPSRETFWAAAGAGAINTRIGWTAELFGYPRAGNAALRDSIVGALLAASFTARPWLVFDAGFSVPVTGPQPNALFFGATWNAGRVWATRR